jgi:hypothetical protein
MGAPPPRRTGKDGENTRGSRKIRDRIIELVPRGLSAALPAGWGAQIVLRAPEGDLLLPLAKLLRPNAWRHIASRPILEALASKVSDEVADPRSLPWGGTSDGEDPDSVLFVRGLTLVDIEREAIRLSLRRHNGKRVAALRELGCAKSTLMDRIARWGLRNEGRMYVQPE